MKKFLGIVLSTSIMLGSVTPIMAENEPTLSGAKISVAPGAEFIMPVTLTNADAVSQFMMDMSFIICWVLTASTFLL